MLSTADIRERIVGQITETLEDIGVVAPSISGSDELSELGVSSMLYARLVLRLEAEFGVEVFTGGEQPPQVRTVDDLVDSFVSSLV
jgi:acyl carrier protein